MIERNVFEKATALKSVEFKWDVTEIRDSAFKDWSSLIVTNAFAINGIIRVLIPSNLELAGNNLVILGRTDCKVDVYVEKGSWADLNFDDVFSSNTVKKYI